jgi:hypothetical protein
MRLWSYEILPNPLTSFIEGCGPKLVEERENDLWMEKEEA